MKNVNIKPEVTFGTMEEVEEERMGSQIQWRLPVFVDTTTAAVAHAF